ncbi:hyaluronidase PH-20-like [Choloepus didactylus]|uniref:hyaluronidase PH-20-like n=1 Tax=Choloepus didactylus TaxID=27675 RepID=UPI0018A01DE5|nr:hyaluronidase PH-20-like [Choloepus didactylus]
MGVLRLKHIFFGSFLGFNGASQAVFTFFLIPCCLALNFRAPPLVPNVPFILAWNAPTELCANKFNVLLDLSLFPLVGSPQKDVTRQDITLFYADRLGYYPHINEVTGASENGGIPQMGSLKSHLDTAANDISQTVPRDHVGLAVIDWENWRPTWERNWKPKDVYKNLSIELVQQHNIQLSVSEATKVAKVEFEKAAKSFMQETLKLGKSLRANYLWGYYLFPDCYNHDYSKPRYNGSCLDIEKRRNDELHWLWKESSALFPSIYLNSHLASSPKAVLFARNRVQEAIRVSKLPNAESPIPVFVYTRPVLTDASSRYLSQDDLVSTIGESVALGVSGSVIWGSFNLTYSRQSCVNLDNYMKTTLNPYLINVTLAAKMCSQVLCQEQGVCVRKDWNSNDYLHLNPVNFAIKTWKGGKYTVHGKPTLKDLQQFSEKFYCSSYTGSSSMKMVDIKHINAIHVCVAEDVCIEAFLDSEEPCGRLSTSTEEHSLPSYNISLPTSSATESPCAPRADFSGYLEGASSAKTISNNAHEGFQYANWKNTVMIYIIQVQLQVLLNFLSMDFIF